MSSSYDLGAKMRSGAIWVYLQGWFGALLQFGAGVVLARILDPADFGVFYAVNAYTVILGQQVNFGIPNALLQARELNDSQWNSAFWVMEGIAVLCTLLVYCFSGWISHFYSDQRYTSIMYLFCVNFFIMPYMFINGSLLRRAMDYKSVSQIMLISSLLAIVVSITLALLGFGPYSLLISSISSSIFSAVLMARKAPWFPSLSFDFSALKPLLRFGWLLHMNNTLSMAASRVDNMMVGSMMGIPELGIYDRAFNLSRMPVREITSRLYQIFFTGLSRVQDNLKHTQSMYKKILCTMTTAVFPFLVILVLQGDRIILFLYGEKWLAASDPLKVMALGSFPYLIAVTLGSLADAHNLVARETPIQFFNIFGTIIAVVIGSRWGLVGISIGVAVKALLLMVLLQQMVARSHIKLKSQLILDAIWPSVMGSLGGFLVGGAAELVLTQAQVESSALHLIIVSLLILSTYISALLTLAKLMPENEALLANIQLLIDLWHRFGLKPTKIPFFSRRSRERA